MPTITQRIVNVNATSSTAPAASTLQQSGALVSVGGTTQTTNTYTYYGTLTALTANLSSGGNYVELTAMATTYFAQGGAVGVYVLELGTQGSASAGITALTTWIAANLGVFYTYCVPATWDTTTASNLNTLCGLYATTTSATYFFITTTSAHLSTYTNKSCVCVVNSPTEVSTNFPAAAFMYQFLANNPGVGSPVPTMNFRYAYSVTAWPANNAGTSTASTITTILSAYGNFIGTGAEGGISTALLRNGTTMDGNQMMYWYAVDWMAIQADLQLANALINASNNGTPIPYNQFGINALLSVLDNIGLTATSYGLVLVATFTATPFNTYSAANPSAYAAGTYGGFFCTMTPQLGFAQITFNLNATNFA